MTKQEFLKKEIKDIMSNIEAGVGEGVGISLENNLTGYIRKDESKIVVPRNVRLTFRQINCLPADLNNKPWSKQKEIIKNMI